MALAVILSAPPAAIPELASSPAARDPSTPRAPPAVMPALARQAPPVLAQHLERDPALGHLVPEAHPGPEALRQPARRRARSAPHPVVAAVARSIQKPRKAR